MEALPRTESPQTIVKPAVVESPQTIESPQQIDSSVAVNAVWESTVLPKRAESPQTMESPQQMLKLRRMLIFPVIGLRTTAGESAGMLTISWLASAANIFK